ncbi:MAG: ABC transporter transmembrane domain-containing protein, partial [Desulfoferrobacter sp.]
MKRNSAADSSSNSSGGIHPQDTSPWSAVSVILPYLKRYATRIIVGFLALISVDFLQLWIPRIIKNAVDDLQMGVATSNRLLVYGGYIIAIALAIAALRFIWRKLLLGFSRLLEMHLRNRMISHILTLDKTFFQRMTTGEIMALATNDLSSVQLATGMGMVAAVDALFMGMAAIGFMAFIDLRLTLIAVAPMPFLAILTRFLSSRLHRRFKRVQEQFSTLTEYVRSTFSSIRLIKAYNQEKAQAERFNNLGETYVRNNLRLAAIYGTLFPLSGLIGNLSLFLVLFFGGRMAINGTITAGDFVAFITYLFIMTWPMMALGWVSDLFQRGVTSLDRINALLEERPTLKAPENVKFSSPVRGTITIKNLSFNYPNQQRPILRNISLNIRQGLFLGIVGPTGAGKTTLCNLLARLYPVPAGRILFDDMDVNRLSLEAIRGAIAYVPQEVVLF